MKVLFLVTGLKRGGAEKQVVDLALGLKNRGWEVVVASLIPFTDYAEDLRLENIKVISLNLQKNIWDLLKIMKFTRTIMKLYPDIIHSHLFHANIVSRLIILWLKCIPSFRKIFLVNTIHSANEGNKTRELFYRLTNFLPNLVTIISQDAAECMLKAKVLPEKKHLIIANGVNIDMYVRIGKKREQIRKEIGLEEKTFCWLNVGRLEKEKNQHALLCAFKKSLQIDSDQSLLIAGEGSLKNELIGIAKELKILDRVLFLGFRQDIPELMSAADGYVSSSLWEGLPLALLEATACQLPIVATDVPGNCEVLRQCQNGFLAKPGDINDLLNKMMILKTMPREERVRMGRIGREKLRDMYELESVLDMWEKIYTDRGNVK